MHTGAESAVSSKANSYQEQTNDGSASCSRSSDDCIHHWLCSFREILKLKHTRRPANHHAIVMYQQQTTAFKENLHSNAILWQKELI